METDIPKGVSVFAIKKVLCYNIRKSKTENDILCLICRYAIEFYLKILKG